MPVLVIGIVRYKIFKKKKNYENKDKSKLKSSDLCKKCVTNCQIPKTNQNISKIKIMLEAV